MKLRLKMKKPDKLLTARETLDILNKQWATKKDIQYLAFVGENKAGEITKEIAKMVFEKTGRVLPKGLYPMKYVQEYLAIDIDYLRKINN